MNLKKELDYITDCFSGIDGGVVFLKLRFLLEEMDKRAKKGDSSAKEILAIVKNFSNLIKVAVTAK